MELHYGLTRDDKEEVVIKLKPDRDNQHYRKVELTIIKIIHYN